ncbi:MAG TPA: BrnT family toxin [Caulobacteraceae bacterium]
MDITFDPVKRDKVLNERGLDFADAGRVFAGRTATAQDSRMAYPEARFITAGVLDERIVVMVWTPTSTGRRIISMRHCHEDEARLWRERMG